MREPNCHRPTTSAISSTHEAVHTHERMPHAMEAVSLTHIHTHRTHMLTHMLTKRRVHMPTHTLSAVRRSHAQHAHANAPLLHAQSQAKLHRHAHAAITPASHGHRIGICIRFASPSTSHPSCIASQPPAPQSVRLLATARIVES